MCGNEKNNTDFYSKFYTQEMLAKATVSKLCLQLQI